MTLSRGRVRTVDLDDLDRQIREFVDQDLGRIVGDHEQPVCAASVEPAVGDDDSNENEPDGQYELSQEFAELDDLGLDGDEVEEIPDTSDSALGRRIERRGFRTAALMYVAPLVFMALGAGAAVVLRAGPAARSTSEAPIAAGDGAPAQQAKIAVGDQTMAVSVTGAAGLPAKPDDSIVVSSTRPTPPADASVPAPATVPVALVKAAPPNPPQGTALSSVFGTPHRVLTESIKPDTATESKDKPGAPPPPPKPRVLALAASTALEKGADATGSVKPAVTRGQPMRATADASSFVVQLGSSPSKSEALATLARLRTQFPDVLRGGSVHRADQGSMGVFYRVQVGPLSRDAADKVCSQLKSTGASCIVTRT
jgi:hypothetical protein